jgi:hypothetical protein
MAITETRQLPPKFIEELGTDLATQLVAQSGRPTVAPGIAGLSRLPGESTEDFTKRREAAEEFDIRKQSIAGLAPTVAGQTGLQTEAQRLATQAAGTSGIASFQPFLTAAQQEAGLASGLGTLALGQLGTAGTELTQAGTALGGAQQALGTAGTTLGGVPLGAQAFQQDVSQFMSPYQSQVIDATLAEFDRNKAIQEQQIRDQQTALGALGSGRAGVQLSEFGTGAARERALLQANLLQQGFGQAQQARQQDIANRFGLGQAQAGIAGAQAGMAGQQAGFAGQRGALAGATQGLGAFRSGLAGQQAALGQAQEGILGTNIGRLGSLGAINQAQAQAEADAQREANRQAAMLPQENLARYGAQVTGLMGGYPGTTTQTFAPNPTPLQTALGIGTTLAGLYLGRKN